MFTDYTKIIIKSGDGGNGEDNGNGTGSTFGNDDSPIYLDDSNNNINP